MDEVVRPTRVRHRGTVALIVAFALLAVVVVTAVLCSVAVAGAMARNDAITLASRLSDYDIGPPMVRTMSGDPVARIALDQIVRDRAGDPMGHFTVWDADGTAVYASGPSTPGQSTPEKTELAAVARSRSTGESSLDRYPNLSPTGVQTVEVYVPIRASAGRLVFEMRYDASHYRDRALALVMPLLGLSVLPLLVLAVVCAPVVLALVRRIHGDHVERSRLLQYALTTSDRERRDIATGLHDTVVQNLAGAGYVLSALEPKVPAESRPGAQTARSVVQDSVESLRTLLVDLHPETLTGTGLPRAIDGLVSSLCDAGLTVTASVRVPTGVHDAVAVALYRVTRERLTQLVAHPHTVHVELGPTDPGIELRITDHPCPPVDTVATTEPDGPDHLGLALLRARVSGLGGTLTATGLPGGGTELVVRFTDGGGHGG